MPFCVNDADDFLLVWSDGYAALHPGLKELAADAEMGALRI